MFADSAARPVQPNVEGFAPASTAASFQLGAVQVRFVLIAVGRNQVLGGG
jgi:hypothetical protein